MGDYMWFYSMRRWKSFYQFGNLEIIAPRLRNFDLNSVPIQNVNYVLFGCATIVVLVITNVITVSGVRKKMK